MTNLYASPVTWQSSIVNPGVVGVATHDDDPTGPRGPNPSPKKIRGAPRPGRPTHHAHSPDCQYDNHRDATKTPRQNDNRIAGPYSSRKDTYTSPR